jgi:molybdopterin-containing oxidoreductase family iron-sulfur binding subunit
LPLRYSEIGQFARALAGKLGLGVNGTVPASAQKWLDVCASDLQKFKGRSLVVAGEFQPAEVHALAHAINASLGNVATTLYYTEPVEANPVNQLQSFTELCADMDAGRVETLLIWGSNPVYDAPHDFDFNSKLKRVGTSILVSSHFDETAEYCKWHVAESHYLETWGDARAFDGTLSVVQPLIAPLYNTRSFFDVLAAFTDKPGQTAYDAVRDRLKAAAGASDPERFWRKTLNDGVVANSAYAPINLALKFTPASLPPAKSPAAGQVEFLFRPDQNVYDGRYANNGWLQELARPVTKLTWDNAALVSPRTAEKLGLTHKAASRGGEHGQILSNVVDIAISNSKVTAAAWILPGQADDVVVLPLGYGRQSAGFTGSNKGFNAYMLRTSASQWAASASADSIKKTGDDYPLACTQYHFQMEGRKIMSSGTLEEYHKNPKFAQEGDERPPKDKQGELTLYKEFA